MSFNPKAKTLAEIQQKEVNKKAIDKLGAKFNPETGKKAPFFIKIDHQYPDREKGALFIFGKIKKYKAETKDLKGYTELHGLAYVEYDAQKVSTLCLAPSKGKLDEKETLLKKAMKDTFKEAYKQYRLLDRIDEDAVDEADDAMGDEPEEEEGDDEVVEIESAEAKKQAQIADLRRYQERFLLKFNDYKINKDASILPILKKDIDKFQYVYSLNPVEEFKPFFDKISALEEDIDRIGVEKELASYAQQITLGFNGFRKSRDQRILPQLKADIDEFQRIYLSGVEIEDEALKSFFSKIGKLEEDIDKLLSQSSKELSVEELVKQIDVIPESEKLEIAALSEQLVDEQNKIKEILSSPLFAYNEGLLLLLRNISTAANPKARGGMVANLDAAIRKLKEGSNFSFRVKKAAVRVEDIEPKISNPLYLKHGDSQVIAQTIWSNQKQVIQELLINGWIEGGYKGASDARKFTKADPAGPLEIIFNYGGGLHDRASFAQQQVSDPLYIKVIRPPHNTIKVVDRNGYSDDDIIAQGSKILFYDKVDFSPINL